MDNSVFISIIACLFSYFNLCSEILSNVRKMEDSIRRLRNARESSKMASSMTQSMSSSTTASMTDDNKIRMQIQQDVQAFSNEVNDWNIVHFNKIFFFSWTNLVFRLTRRIN